MRTGCREQSDAAIQLSAGVSGELDPEPRASARQSVAYEDAHFGRETTVRDTTRLETRRDYLAASISGQELRRTRARESTGTQEELLGTIPLCIGRTPSHPQGSASQSKFRRAQC